MVGDDRPVGVGQRVARYRRSSPVVAWVVNELSVNSQELEISPGQCVSPSTMSSCAPLGKDVSSSTASVLYDAASGDTWGKREEKVGTTTTSVRATIKEVSPTVYTFKLEMSQNGGAWMTVSEAKSTKTGQ